MDETHLCVCCLRCPPDKDLTPYADHDKTEIYSNMLQDCFNIQMVVDGCGLCGICFTCAGRLRDASDFKLQVQRCQAEMRARTARCHVKEEEPDMELPEDHEEETGYESVLQELLGPGLADGAGASDDEESTVKQEMITVDEGELYAEPVVEAEESGGAARDEERPQHELPGPGLADGAGASDDEESTVKLDMITIDEGELYAEPAVRSEAPAAAASDEERPQLGAESAVSLRARRQLAAACAVRLERLRAPPAPARRASAQHTYACDMCTQRFNSKSVLIRHIGTHYRCEVCDKTFMMSACLTRHERNCTENKQKEGKLANKNTLSKSHGEVVLYYCDECGKGYKCKTFLSKHIQRSHPVRQVLNNSHSRLFKRQVRQKKPFHCSQCVFKSSTKYLLQGHQMIHTGEKPFKCDFCVLKFSHKSHLLTHRGTHTGEKPFKCGYCDYTCRLKQNLQTHQRIHTGDKPFECDFCDFKCNQKSSLQRHQRTHTGENTFKCDFCVLKFSQKSHLLTHRGTHTGEKPFKCGYCDYTCRLKQNLQTHQRIHTGDKPFECDFCDFKCNQKSSLQRHQRTHTGENTFKCGICDFQCSHKFSLQRHQRTHTAEKPFECDYCDYKCSDKSNFRRHQRIHTGESRSNVTFATTSVVKNQAYKST